MDCGSFGSSLIGAGLLSSLELNLDKMTSSELDDISNKKIRVQHINIKMSNDLGEKLNRIFLAI